MFPRYYILPSDNIVFANFVINCIKCMCVSYKTVFLVFAIGLLLAINTCIIRAILMFITNGQLLFTTSPNTCKNLYMW